MLQSIVAKTWGKEDELKLLKSELAALDRKIAAALAPKHDEKDGEEVKHDERKVVETPTQSSGQKKPMVAEPTPSYDHDIHQPQQQPQHPGRFVASTTSLNQHSGYRNGPKM